MEAGLSDQALKVLRAALHENEFGALGLLRLAIGLNVGKRVSPVTLANCTH